jgi:hypothetical protein
MYPGAVHNNCQAYPTWRAEQSSLEDWSTIPGKLKYNTVSGRLKFNTWKTEISYQKGWSIIPARGIITAEGWSIIPDRLKHHIRKAEESYLKAEFLIIIRIRRIRNFLGLRILHLKGWSIIHGKAEVTYLAAWSIIPGSLKYHTWKAEVSNLEGWSFIYQKAEVSYFND